MCYSCVYVCFLLNIVKLYISVNFDKRAWDNAETKSLSSLQQLLAFQNAAKPTPHLGVSMQPSFCEYSLELQFDRKPKTSGSFIFLKKVLRNYKDFATFANYLNTLFCFCLIILNTLYNFGHKNDSE